MFFYEKKHYTLPRIHIYIVHPHFLALLRFHLMTTTREFCSRHHKGWLLLKTSIRDHKRHWTKEIKLHFSWTGCSQYKCKQQNGRKQTTNTSVAENVV